MNATPDVISASAKLPAPVLVAITARAATRVLPTLWYELDGEDTLSTSAEIVRLSFKSARQAMKGALSFHRAVSLGADAAHVDYVSASTAFDLNQLSAEQARCIGSLEPISVSDELAALVDAHLARSLGPVVVLDKSRLSINGRQKEFDLRGALFACEDLYENDPLGAPLCDALKSDITEAVEMDAAACLEQPLWLGRAVPDELEEAWSALSDWILTSRTSELLGLIRWYESTLRGRN